MGLAASVFRVDSVLVWLADGDRVFVRPGCNAFPMGSRSACCHLLVPDAHVLAVDDTRAEPRCAAVHTGSVPASARRQGEVSGAACPSGQAWPVCRSVHSRPHPIQPRVAKPTTCCIR
jgi:hypothetical protein